MRTNPLEDEAIVVFPEQQLAICQHVYRFNHCFPVTIRRRCLIWLVSNDRLADRLIISMSRKLRGHCHISRVWFLPVGCDLSITDGGIRMAHRTVLVAPFSGK